MRIITAFAILLLIAAAPLQAGIAPVHVLQVTDQIDPAVADYVLDGLKAAQEEDAQAVVVLLNTPGGLMTSMDKITSAFLADRIPVIVFVYPEDASAGSAGAFITMAANVAAMVPVSKIGASTPINISPTGESEKQSSEDQKALKRKQVNFASAQIKAIAEARDRNARVAVEFVTNARSLTAREALKLNIVDLIADDIPDLMKKLDGRKVKLGKRTVVLRTAKAPIGERPMGAWDSFLHFLSNPLVALFLFLATMYGIIYELSNPGSIFPGVVGMIALIMLLYSFSVIPLNAAGLALVVLAIVFFVIELYIGGSGILAVGGIISFFIGLMMLFRAAEGYMVPIWVLAVVTAITGGFFLIVLGRGIKALRNPYIGGREGVVGEIGEAKTDLDPSGKVFVSGTWWNATTESGPIRAGEKVEVTEMTGLRLTVRKHNTT